MGRDFILPCMYHTVQGPTGPFDVADDPNLSITFPAGSGPLAQQCFFVNINDDNLCEGTESFIVEPSDPALFPPNADSLDVNILDNDREYLRSLKTKFHQGEP